jgi:hypothetical protein
MEWTIGKTAPRSYPATSRGQDLTQNSDAARLRLDPPTATCGGWHRTFEWLEMLISYYITGGEGARNPASDQESNSHHYSNQDSNCAAFTCCFYNDERAMAGCAHTSSTVVLYAPVSV